MTFFVVVVIALIWTIFYEISMYFLRKKRNYNRLSTNFLFFTNLVVLVSVVSYFMYAFFSWLF